MLAHERLIETRVTMVRLLAKPRSISNIPAFSDLNGIINHCKGLISVTTYYIILYNFNDLQYDVVSGFIDVSSYR